MIKNFLLACALVVLFFSCKQDVEWISTTESKPWVENKRLFADKSTEEAQVVINRDDTLQQIIGFGGCFNELGWTSLNRLSQADRELILKELFEPGYGANFTICRMPVGANDFSRDWYSYNETEGDFEMNNFSIDNDFETLIPFIREAKKYNPDIYLWASPWSPPAWMKYNSHYACAVPGEGLDAKYHNNLPPDRQGKEGTNMFIQEEEYFKAYALYFSKFVEAYRDAGIDISMIMPQNEFNSCQIFPSCTWTAAGLARFIGDHLGPAMEQQKVEIMFGTMERPNEALVDTILNDPKAGKYISGVGFQWGGKESIPGLHKRYPEMKLFQTEQECGDGKNDWAYCNYAWSLMKHYLNNGASAYLYWNISLEEGGFSRWGWQQNSLVTVNPDAKSYRFNHEYYLMKHVSHYVKPGARMLRPEGDYKNLLAFRNPDNSVVVVVQNESDESKQVKFIIDGKSIAPVLEAQSFNTLVVN